MSNRHISLNRSHKAPQACSGGMTLRRIAYLLTFVTVASIAPAVEINLDATNYGTVDQVNAFFNSFVHSPDPCDIINLPPDTEYRIGTAYTPGFVIPNGVNNIIWNWNGSRLIGPSMVNDRFGVYINGCENVVINGANVTNFQGFIRIGGEWSNEPPYENIAIINAYCDTQIGLAHTNVYATSEVTGPSIVFRDSIIKTVEHGVKYVPIQTTTEFTKYARNQNITALIGSGVFANLPRITAPGPRFREILGADPNSMRGIAVIGGASLLPESQQIDLGSPQDVGQEGTTTPYINSINNCFATDDMRFIPGSYVPDSNSPLIVKDPNGRWVGYIGAIKPRLSADSDGNSHVDFSDYARLISLFGLTSEQAGWDPNYDISEPNDNVIDYRDLEVLLKQWIRWGADAQPSIQGQQHSIAFHKSRNYTNRKELTPLDVRCN